MKKRPPGHPRVQFRPHLEFTPEAYDILDAAAGRVLQRLGLLQGQFVTKEDLIDHCWMTTFFYVKTPRELHRFMFLHAEAEMARYIKDKIGPRKYQRIEGDEGLDLPPYDQVSGRDLDDPAVMAALVDAWERLEPGPRRVLFETLAQGLEPQQAERLGRWRSAVTAALRRRCWSPRDRYILRQCLLVRRSYRQVAREVGISRQRVQQIVGKALARAARPDRPGSHRRRNS